MEKQVLRALYWMLSKVPFSSNILCFWKKDKNIANTDNHEKNGLLLSLWQNNLFFFQSDLLIHFNLFIDVERKKKETLHIGIYDPLLPVMRLLSVLLTVFI